MQPDALREGLDWIRRATRDLDVAKLSLQGPPMLPDIPRTHDLVSLVAHCQAIAPGFAQFLPVAQMLTPSAVRFRYPPGLLEPPLPEAEEALGLAAAVVAFVQQQFLPTSTS